MKKYPIKMFIKECLITLIKLLYEKNKLIKIKYRVSDQYYDCFYGFNNTVPIILKEQFTVSEASKIADTIIKQITPPDNFSMVDSKRILKTHSFVNALIYVIMYIFFDEEYSNKIVLPLNNFSVSKCIDSMQDKTFSIDQSIKFSEGPSNYSCGKIKYCALPSYLHIQSSCYDYIYNYLINYDQKDNPITIDLTSFNLTKLPEKFKIIYKKAKCNFFNTSIMYTYSKPLFTPNYNETFVIKNEAENENEIKKKYPQYDSSVNKIKNGYIEILNTNLFETNIKYTNYGKESSILNSNYISKFMTENKQTNLSKQYVKFIKDWGLRYFPAGNSDRREHLVKGATDMNQVFIYDILEDNSEYIEPSFTFLVYSIVKTIKNLKCTKVSKNKAKM